MYRDEQPDGFLLGRLAGPIARASRYDFVLAVIPTAFVLAAVVGASLRVPPSAIFVAAAAVSSLAVLDALFLNPPRDPSAGQPRA